MKWKQSVSGTLSLSSTPSSFPLPPSPLILSFSKEVGQESSRSIATSIQVQRTKWLWTLYLLWGNLVSRAESAAPICWILDTTMILGHPFPLWPPLPCDVTGTHLGGLVSPALKYKLWYMRLICHLLEVSPFSLFLKEWAFETKQLCIWFVLTKMNNTWLGLSYVKSLLCSRLKCVFAEFFPLKLAHQLQPPSSSFA